MTVLSDADFAGVRKPLPDAHWLPARAYTDPAVWPLEQERIFRREWLVVGRHDQLPQPGDYLTKEISGANLLLVRGDDGVIRAFHNVCRHRGMLVAKGCGQTRNFVCPYHSWTYGLDGCLLAAPEMANTADFNLDQIGLRAVRCETWQGFVAINLDYNARPFGSDLSELAEIVAPWGMADMVTVYERAYTTAWDWKLMWENAIESYHTSSIHRESAAGFIPTPLSYVCEDWDGRPWSDLHTPFSESLPPPAPGAPPVIESLPEFTNREFVFFHVWPCFGFYLNPDKVASYICEPVAPGKHRFIWRFMVQKDAVGQDDFSQWRDNTAARYHQIQTEDEMACRGVQAGLETGAWSPGRYSDKERACWHFHRWYADRMTDPDTV
jgi:Rieske 2Fe-2S family protein